MLSRDDVMAEEENHVCWLSWFVWYHWHRYLLTLMSVDLCIDFTSYAKIHWVQFGKHLHATVWTNTKECTEVLKSSLFASSSTTILSKSCMQRPRSQKSQAEIGIMLVLEGRDDAPPCHVFWSLNHWWCVGNDIFIWHNTYYTFISPSVLWR